MKKSTEERLIMKKLADLTLEMTQLQLILYSRTLDDWSSIAGQWPRKIKLAKHILNLSKPEFRKRIEFLSEELV